MQSDLFLFQEKVPEIELSGNQCAYRDPDVLLPPFEDFLKNNPLPPQPKAYEIIQEEDSFLEVIQQLHNASWIAYDTETEGMAKKRHRIIGYCFSYRLDGGAPQSMYDALRNVYIPVRHRTGEACLNATFVREHLKPVIGSRSKVWMMWNANYDEHMSANDSLTFAGHVLDGIIPRRLLQPTDSGALKAVAEEWLDAGAREAQEAIAEYIKVLCKANKWAIPKRDPMRRSYYEYIPLRLMGFYAPRDTHYTWACAGEGLRRIQHYPNLLKIHENEQRLRKPLFEMERLGLYVNEKTRLESDHKAEKMLKELEGEAKQIAGREFNLGSTEKIVMIFTGLGIPLNRPTDKSRDLPKSQQTFSTDAKVMSRLVHKGYRLPEVILQWRQLRECKNKSLKYMRDYTDTDGCIHPSFWQSGTTSARVVSSGPNVQNFPNHGIQKELIRGAFEIHPQFRDGYTWIFADLSQIELRILAHISQDHLLLEAYQQGRDIHAETAIRIFGPEAWERGTDEERYDMRSAGKATNFGIIYQIGSEGLSDALFKVGIIKSQAECKEFIRVFKSAYPTITRWISGTILKAKREGTLTNLFGRTRDFSEVNTLRGGLQKKMERELVNWVIQSSAADLFKTGIVWLDKKRTEMGWSEGWRWVNNIHDELQFYIKDEWLIQAIAWVKYCFEEVLSKHLDVPILLDIETSKSTWLAKEGVNG